MPVALRLALLLVAAAFVILPSGPAAAQQTVTVQVGDLWFCAPSFQDGVCTTTVDVGDTVTWAFGDTNEPHTTTECGATCDNGTSSPLWDSDVVSGGATFSHTFGGAGTFLYYCEIHPVTMRGRIVVQGAQQPPTATASSPGAPLGSTPASGGTPGVNATPASGGTTPVAGNTATVSGAPAAGAGGVGGTAGGGWWLPAALAAAGALCVLGASLARRAGRPTAD
jgi:plastocyanin